MSYLSPSEFVLSECVKLYGSDLRRNLCVTVCAVPERNFTRSGVRPLGGGWSDPRKSVPVETMRVSVRVRLCVVMEGAQLVPLAQSRGPFSPSRSTWRLSCGLGYAATPSCPAGQGHVCGVV